MALKHAEPGEAVDLRPLGASFDSATTRAIVKRPSFEAIQLVVPAGGEVPTHKVEGDVTLHCLEGRVRLERPDDEVELAAGDWLYLEGGEPHALRGVENAMLLLTILFRR